MSSKFENNAPFQPFPSFKQKIDFFLPENISHTSMCKIKFVKCCKHNDCLLNNTTRIESMMQQKNKKRLFVK